MSSPTGTWITLMAATLGSFVTAEYFQHRHIAVAAILLIAAFKVRTIIRNFMELKHAPVAWRAGFDVWTTACATMIIGLCWYTLS